MEVKRVSGQWSERPKDTVYVYTQRGFSITVSPRSVTDLHPELIKMDFFPVPTN